MRGGSDLDSDEAKTRRRRTKEQVQAKNKTGTNTFQSDTPAGRRIIHIMESGLRRDAAMFSNRCCSHSTRLRRPASASPLKRKIPLSRRTEGWDPGPSFFISFHRAFTSIFGILCSALLLSCPILSLLNLSSLSMIFRWCSCGSHILHNLSLPCSSQSLHLNTSEGILHIS